ncbi:SDR family oxidoreductase [Herbaspirillum sp. SJZ099]|uniref:SDR family oxidoreductase n=1 Tax=Herbaspirillum sp. SJZ099 TaxID=2572916 RepID=UPI0011A25CEE|nr:SDR family oxidoreductase [Herbaspirillum sp. SJZ099]TWC71684.1 nucleoside-diphosphate-sugar epimerase [Herbaspirillum sp. SJZ099]
MSTENTGKQTALVVGAKGVIGSKLIEHLLTLPEWDVIGLSRRGGEDRADGRLRHIAVDLLDAGDTRAKLAPLEHVTHIFYTAYQHRATWSELVAPNLAMLENTVETVEAAAPGLRHISLMQGYKVYGGHLGPFKTPARETDAQFMPPEFMFDQQRYLEQRQAQSGQRWSWSAIRPAVVGGAALGNPMNLALAIAVYASISKALGLPLRFPGKPGAYDKLVEMTDAGLLAKATVWAAANEGCANQAFNIGNGDIFRWSEMWPKIARWFDMEVGPPLPLALADVMSDKAPLWETIARAHGLAAHSYDTLSSWGFADFVFSWDYDMFGDGSKARRFGFHEYVESERMFYRLFDEFRRNKVIP